jgi:hypothetical protein
MNALPSSIGTKSCFFDELIRTCHGGKNEVPGGGLLATYRCDDPARALKRAVRYRAFSWSAVERTPAGAIPHAVARR